MTFVQKESRTDGANDCEESDPRRLNALEQVCLAGLEDIQRLVPPN
jgi:hypothetical protein